MMILTAEDIHAAFLKTRRENYSNTASWAVEWEQLNDKEKLCYDRMAELLNKKVVQPEESPESSSLIRP